jgi:undecaprenyl-diphosphatase
MFQLDRQLAVFLNACAQHTPGLDKALAFFGQMALLKGGVLVALLTWLWFSRRSDQAMARPLVLVAVLGASTGAVLSRGLTYVLPFQSRPLWDPTLGLTMPHVQLPEFLDKWSSLPSDHASLFVGLSFGVFRISKRLGVFAFLYSLAVALFPRVYLGIHFLSDEVAGALVGVLAVWVAGLPAVRTYTVRPALALHDRSPGTFYACAFVVGDQIVSLFGDLRTIGGVIARVLGRLLHLHG